MERRGEPAHLDAAEWFATAPGAERASPPMRVFELRDFTAVVSKRWKLIAFCVAACALAAGLYGLTSPKRYIANSEILIDTRGLKIVDGDVNQRFENAETLNADLESQIRIMSSGSVLRGVAERENLASDPDFVARPGILGRLKALVTGQPPGPRDPEGAAVSVLDKTVTIRRSEKSFVVDISASASTPEKAARIAQAIGEVYIETQLRTRQMAAKRIGEEVAARLKDLRTQLEAAEKRLEDYKNNNNLVYANGKLALDQDITELATQLNQARARTARARARVDQIKALPANASLEALAEILDSPTIIQLRVRLAEASRQESELRQSLGPLHPEIAAAAARVADARRAIDQEIVRRRQAADAELTQASGTERAMAAQIERAKKQTETAGQSLIGARELERAADANRKVYEQFLVRAREITEQSGFQPNLSRVISNATAQPNPIGLSVPVLTILGGLGGLPIGVGLAFLLHMLSAKPVEAQPAMRQARQVGLKPELKRTVVGEIDRSFVHHYVARRKFQRPAAPPPAIVELASRIGRRSSGDPLRILLIAAVTDREAGSEFALALASSFAWQGLDVVAVDGDAQNCGLTRLAGQTGKSGLFDRLDARMIVDDLVIWNRNGLPHLLPASIVPNKPVGGETRRDIVGRIERLCAGVDMIIIDAGRAVSNPFISLLAEAASDFVVVTDVARDNPAGIDAACEAVQRANAPAPMLVSLTGEAPTQEASDNIASIASKMKRPYADDHDDDGKKRWHFRRKRIVSERKPEKA
jgi:succinoglycan biosynthesis transport protein ExoP